MSDLGTQFDGPQPAWARNMESRILARIDASEREVARLLTAATDNIVAAVAAAVVADRQAIIDAAAAIVAQLQQPPTSTNPGPAVGIRLTVGGPPA